MYLLGKWIIENISEIPISDNEKKEYTLQTESLIIRMFNSITEYSIVFTWNNKETMDGKLEILQYIVY